MRRSLGAMLALTATTGLALWGLGGAPSPAEAEKGGGRGTPARIAPPEVLPPEIALPLPPQPRPEVVEPGSRAAGRVLGVLGRIQGRLRRTRYQHPTVVRERQGLYAWDCSGMAAWILQRSAPGALRAVHRERPVARDFHRIISSSPTDRARRSWRRLAHIDEARPGDVFAWLRPPDWPRRNTGHVGFVVEAPRPVPWIADAYAIRIADATSVPHQNDTRPSRGDGGFGTGTILFTTDGEGQATAYGWYGTESRGVVPTTIVFGRVTR